MTKLLRTVCALVAALVLNACGGGGDASAPPTFVVTALVGGVIVAGFIADPDHDASVSIDPGQGITFKSDVPVTFTIGPTGVTLDAVVFDANTWSAAGLSAVPGGSLTIRVALPADPTREAVITVNVAPQRFERLPALLGETLVFGVTEARRDGVASNHSATYTTASVAGDGSSVQNVVDGNGVLAQTRTLDANGNRLTRTYTSNGNVCSYSPARVDLDFPLYIGKTWTSNWTYACSAGYHEDAASAASIDAYEPVVTAAGTFNALRIRQAITLTNSNDPNLLLGIIGNAAYAIETTCWWSIELKRTVKCEDSTTYVGGAPGTYLSEYVESLVSISR